MNNVVLSGVVVEEPVVGTSSSNLKFAKFKMNVLKYSKDDNKDYDTFEVVVFKNLADIALKIGQSIELTGRLSANNHEKDSNIYYNASIIGSSIAILE